MADIAERLMTEFGHRAEPATISRVVLGCRHDLQGSAAASRIVGLEHLARRRLLAQTRPH